MDVKKLQGFTNSKDGAKFEDFEVKYPHLVVSEALEIKEPTTKKGVKSLVHQRIKEKFPRRIMNALSYGIRDWGLLNLLALGKVNYGKTDNGECYGYVDFGDKISLATINPHENVHRKHVVNAATIEDGEIRNINVGYESQEPIAILAAAIGFLEETLEVREVVELRDIIDNIELANFHEDILFQLSSYFWYGLFGGYDAPELDFGLNFESGRVNQMAQYVVEEIVQKSSGESVTAEIKNITVDFLLEMSELSGKKWTREEIEQDELLSTLAFETEDSRKTFKNFFQSFTIGKRQKVSKAPFVFRLIGSAGTGKSTIVAAAAKLAGMPYRPIASNDEKFSEADLVAKIIPAIEVDDSVLRQGIVIPKSSSQSVLKELGLSFLDLTMFPEFSYTTIYGEEPKGSVDPELLFQEISRREVNKALSQSKEQQGKNFMMVLTELGKTLLFGGVAEIQEYNMIMNMNECVHFYKILQEKVFSLPNEEVMNVHPDAKLVFTMNNSAGVTRDFPPAFDTRNFSTIRFKPASAETMASQAVKYFASQGYELDRNQVLAMANFMDSIRDLARSDELISVRALFNWILASLDGMSLVDSCLITVINGASNDEEMLEEMTGMLEASEFYSYDSLSFESVVDEEL